MDVGDFTLDCANPQCEASFEKTIDLYQAIKSLDKTREWRTASLYWINRLCSDTGAVMKLLHEGSQRPVDITHLLKVKEACFTIGYPKNNLPRLETDITELTLLRESTQFEIVFTNVREVTNVGSL